VCQASGAYCNLRYARVVPWLICTLDVVSAVGAGMTVKFFPLFFKEDYGLNPGTSAWQWVDDGWVEIAHSTEKRFKMFL